MRVKSAFNRLAAFALALAMIACILLTACSGSSGNGSGSTNPYTIEKIANEILGKSSSELVLAYNKELDEKARAYFYSRTNNIFDTSDEAIDASYAAAKIDSSNEYVEPLIHTTMSTDLIATGIAERTLAAYAEGFTYKDFGYFSSYYTSPIDSEKYYVTVVVFTYTENKSEPNGELTILNVTAKVEQVSKEPLTFAVEIRNGDDNPISVNSENFQCSVKHSNGETDYYNDCLIFSNITCPSKNETYASLSIESLDKNEDLSFTMALSSSVALESGDEVTICYIPRLAYSNYVASWVYDI